MGSDACAWVDSTKVSEKLVAFLFNMQLGVIRETLLHTYRSTRRHFQSECNFQEQFLMANIKLGLS
jgi:hypothetical protein